MTTIYLKRYIILLSRKKILDQLAKNNLTIAGEIKSSFNPPLNKIKAAVTKKYTEYLSQGNQKYADYVQKELSKRSGGIFTRLFGS